MKSISFNFKSLSLLILLLLLTSCGRTSTEEGQSPTVIEEASPKVEETQPSQSEETSSANTEKSDTSKVTQKASANTEKLAASNKIKPGEYCFKTETKTLSGLARLTVGQNNRVTGKSEATIQDEAQGYYTSYTQSFKGILNDQQLKVAITTKIENDTQNTQETWTLTENSLNTGREIYKKSDCSSLNQQSSEEGSQPSTEQSSKPVRLKFAAGTSEAVVENAVVRGERATYLLGAKAGQKMTVSITSVENNAVFDVIAPNRQTIQQEATNASFTLPKTGDYSVIVGGTRGNATYKLRVEIK